MEPEYINPTRATRTKLIVASILVVAVELAMDYWWEPFMVYVKSLSTCASLPWLRGIAVMFTLLSFAVAAIFARAGYLTLKYHQTPFPGAWIWSRTKIKRGFVAVATGWGGAVFAAIFAIVPPVVWYVFKVNILFCVPESCGCP